MSLVLLDEVYEFLCGQADPSSFLDELTCELAQRVPIAGAEHRDAPAWSHLDQPESLEFGVRLADRVHVDLERRSELPDGWKSITDVEFAGLKRALNLCGNLPVQRLGISGG